jgi:Transposase
MAQLATTSRAPVIRSGTAVPSIHRLRKEGMAMTIVEAPPGITGGVDTHLDVHVAAALDPLGRLIGTESFSTDTAGYRALLSWLRSFGDVTKVGVEGTGSYGAGLARFLRREHV